MTYRKTAHSIYSLKYHLVWITKYRKLVLHGEIGKRLRELIRQTCATLEVYIESGHIASDHIHLLVSVPPSTSVSQLMQRLKGRTSRLLLVEFGELKKQFWGSHMAPRGYFAASSWNVTVEIIKQSMEPQGENLPPPDENRTFSLGD